MKHFDIICIGGRLATLLLLKELKPNLGGRTVCVIEPQHSKDRPTSHWSYWSSEPTYFDDFSLGTWQQVQIGKRATQHLKPYALRVVRSNDVLAELTKHLKDSRIVLLRDKAQPVTFDGSTYKVQTTNSRLTADWVFDSAAGIEPVFPVISEPKAVLSGNGLVVSSNRPVFDSKTATLFERLPATAGFAYVLPFSSTKALVETAIFGSQKATDTTDVLKSYLKNKWPGVTFSTQHSEYGVIPLGFPPSTTTGPHHILIGTKRGLVKPSAGYGIMNIWRESKELGSLWSQRHVLPPTHKQESAWKFMDKTFLKLAATNPPAAIELIESTMSKLPVSKCLALLDESLSPLERTAFMTRMLPRVVKHLMQHK